jgi:phosphotriesterase-related protein
MHEHLISSAAGVPQNYNELLGEGFRERVIDGLQSAKAEGIDTIVDATTLDLGRDINLMIESSRLTGVNIIAVTGFWLEAPI